MSSDKREGWLADLKPDDRVGVVGGRHNLVGEAKVLRITPTGRIVVAQLASSIAAITFNHMGEEMGGDAWSGTRTLKPLAEVADAIARRKGEHRALNLLRKLGGVGRKRVEAMSDNQLFNFSAQLRAAISTAQGETDADDG